MQPHVPAHAHFDRTLTLEIHHQRQRSGNFNAKELVPCFSSSSRLGFNDAKGYIGVAIYAIGDATLPAIGFGAMRLSANFVGTDED
ncbi:hypothetical protein BDZ89DRAFT_1087608, partial [Hymenopellis radicata]